MDLKRIWIKIFEVYGVILLNIDYIMTMAIKSVPWTTKRLQQLTKQQFSLYEKHITTAKQDCFSTSSVTSYVKMT